MDIHSHIQMEHVFDKIIKSCTDRIAAASHIIHDEHSTTSEFRSATASGIRWKRAMAAFTMLLHMLREMIEDAKHQPTGDLRLKKYDQVFHYLGYVLYLSRRTASHYLIAFGEHKFLMEFAVIKGFPPAKKKELRDPYKAAARN